MANNVPLVAPESRRQQGSSAPRQDGGGADNDLERGNAKPQPSGATAGGGQTKTGCWPIQLCCCAPPGVRAIIPGTCQVIQDSTHLALLAGVIGATILLAEDVYGLLNPSTWTVVFWCILPLTCIATIPNLMYLLKILGTYDEQIQVKEAAISDRKKELAASYENLIASIDELLGRAAESSATMAERGFESKRRDFQRFLEHSETRYKNIVCDEAQSKDMLMQFKRFTKRWLIVFQECSMDPISKPNIVIRDEELEGCKTIGEVAHKIIEKLKITEVRFISSKQDEEKKLLRGCRAEHRRLTMDPRQLLALHDRANSNEAPPSEIELMPTTSASVNRGQPTEINHSSSGQKWLQPNGNSMERTLQATNDTWYFGWLAFGVCGCGIKKGQGTLHDGYPWKLQLKVLQIMVLSKEHMMLLVGTVLAVPILMLCLCDDDQLMGFLPALCYLVCLLNMLMRFEKIDVVQRLEREVLQLQEQSETIKTRREQMVNFWNDMQQLTDLWVHRTVPRLDLLKEVQGHLEFSSPDDHLPFMAKANNCLEDLEKNLPALLYWRGDGDLSEESKKAFSEWILKLCQEDNLPVMLQKLNENSPKLFELSN